MSLPILHTEGRAIVGDFPKIVHVFLKTCNHMFASPPLERAPNKRTTLYTLETLLELVFLIQQVHVVNNNVIFVIVVNDHCIANVDNDEALNRVPKQMTINRHCCHCQKQQWCRKKGHHQERICRLVSLSLLLTTTMSLMLTMTRC